LTKSLHVMASPLKMYCLAVNYYAQHLIGGEGVKAVLQMSYHELLLLSERWHCVMCVGNQLNIHGLGYSSVANLFVNHMTLMQAIINLFESFYKFCNSRKSKHQLVPIATCVIVGVACRVTA